MVQLLLVGHCTTPSLLDIGQQLRPPVVMGGEVDEISEVSLEIRKFRHVNNFQHLTVLVLLGMKQLNSVDLMFFI